jgi:hypothetical protein
MGKVWVGWRGWELVWLPQSTEPKMQENGYFNEKNWCCALNK